MPHEKGIGGAVYFASGSFWWIGDAGHDGRGCKSVGNCFNYW